LQRAHQFRTLCQLQLDITGAVSSNFAICSGSSCTTATTPLNVSVISAPQSCAEPDGECRVFLTQTTTEGTISQGTSLIGPAATTCSVAPYIGNPFTVANCICNYEAANIWSITGTTFKAWISTSTVSAPTNIGYNANLTYLSIMPSGAIIADPSTTLIGGHLLSPIAPSSSATPSTGTNDNGTIESGFACSDWTTTSGDVGSGGAGTDFGWSLGLNNSCGSAQPLYCFETP
jgi:hypothetical protein